MVIFWGFIALAVNFYGAYLAFSKNKFILAYLNMFCAGAIFGMMISKGW